MRKDLSTILKSCFENLHQIHFFFRMILLAKIINSFKIINKCYNFLLIHLQIPKDTESLTKWLYDRFIEKNQILSGFYQTGSFQYPTANTPTIVQQDPLRYIILHIFFITSTYIHIQMLSMLYNYYNLYAFSSLT